MTTHHSDILVCVHQCQYLYLFAIDRDDHLAHSHITVAGVWVYQHDVGANVYSRKSFCQQDCWTRRIVLHLQKNVYEVTLTSAKPCGKPTD